jgi:hypothetical protein
MSDVVQLAGYQQALGAAGVTFDPALIRDAMMTNANDGYSNVLQTKLPEK